MPPGGSLPPNTKRLVDAAPTSTASAAYRSQRPASASAWAQGEVCSSSTTTASPAAWPTPKAKAPDSTWPSTAETARQLTVYVPSGSGVDGVTRIDCLSPGTACGAETPGTAAPSPSSTRTSDSLTSGASENVSTMCRGDAGTDEPAAGSELSSAECAAAAAGNATHAAVTAITAAASRRSAGRRAVIARAGRRR